MQRGTQNSIKTQERQQSSQSTARPKILITLKRNEDQNWSTANLQINECRSGTVNPPPQIGSSATPEAASAAPGATNDVAPAISSGNHVTASVAENVNSFLNGIRATFRQDNVYVSSRLTQKKSDAKNRSNDGGQI